MGNLIVSRSIPAPTPRIAETMDAEQLKSHRARIAFEVRVMLHAHFEPSESDEIKAALLAWFCDELQDWTHEQVVWAIRSWNRDNPRRRPTPGDLVSLLKRARGEKVARDMAALPKPSEPQKDRVSPEAAAAIMAEMGVRNPLAVKTVAGIEAAE